MNSLKKLAVVLAMFGGAMWLVPAATMTGCGGAGGGSATGGGSGGGGGTGNDDGGTSCFAGTPATNAEFLNACTPASVEKIEKQTTWRNPGVTLPQLP